jgi:nicotinate-nucleotide pyrophosphorylase (carboxylating)
VKSQPFGPLEPALYREIVRRALAEDLGWGDVTTEGTVGPDQRARGVLVAKAHCVVAGLDVAIEAFRQLDPSATFTVMRPDSETCAPGDTIAEMQGLATAMLTAERTALNFLQRLCGIATLTRRFVEAAAGRILVLDTRKTTPTLRVLEKYAVRAGGGTNHRMGLDDGILIKDNHVRLAGGIAAALGRMREAATEMPVEIEVQSLAELEEALASGATRVLADNFAPDELKEVVRRARGRAQIEISGGVTLTSVADFATTGADFVSVGALTHSAPAIDISFEIEPIAAE